MEETFETPLQWITCPNYCLGEFAERAGVAKNTTRSQIISRLLAHGADPNMRLDEGATTVLHEIAKVDGFIAPILSSGLNLEEKDSQGRTPLLASWDRPTNGQPVFMYTYAAMELIRAGASIHTSDNDGLTPLHLAIKAGDLDVIDLLLERGASVSAKDHFDLSPLYYALRQKDISNRYWISVQLLDAGAEPLLIGSDGETPLHYLAPCLMQFSSIEGKDRSQYQYTHSWSTFPEYPTLYPTFHRCGL